MKNIRELLKQCALVNKGNEFQCPSGGDGIN